MTKEEYKEKLAKQYQDNINFFIKKPLKFIVMVPFFLIGTVLLPIFIPLSLIQSLRSFVWLKKLNNEKFLEKSYQSFLRKREKAIEEKNKRLFGNIIA